MQRFYQWENLRKLADLFKWGKKLLCYLHLVEIFIKNALIHPNNFTAKILLNCWKPSSPWLRITVTTLFLSSLHNTTTGDCYLLSNFEGERKFIEILSGWAIERTNLDTIVWLFLMKTFQKFWSTGNCPFLEV